MAIFTAIASVFTAVGSFIGGLGAVGAFLLKTAVGLGVSLLAQSLAGKPKDPTFSINGTLQGGGDVARSFIMGRTATAGSLVFVNTWGQDGDTPNAYLTQVIALSDLPVRGLAEVWVNGELVTLGGLTDRGYAVNEYPDSLWVKFYDGTQTTADSFLFTSVSNGNRWWNPDRIGRGVAYRAASLLLDVPANPALPTRVIVQAGQFVVASDDGATIKRPFTVQDGVLYANDIRVNKLSAFTSVLGNVNIEEAYIGNLQVGTSNIAPGAITRYDYTTVESADVVNTFANVMSFTSFHGAGSPLVEVMLNAAIGAPSGSEAEYRIVVADDSSILRQRIVPGGPSPSRTIPSTEVVVMTPPSGRTQTTFQLQIRSTATGFSAGIRGGYMRAFVMKR